ncbi:MAG: transposase family protein, partial [Bacteroidota bacterium]
ACNRMAPSQPQAPPADIRCPEYPFHLICADFFTYKGKHYLVVVDRYSHWLIVDRAQEGSKGLINTLRRTFSTYGIPDELASDGGLEFMSAITQKFLKDWGVSHRVSSVGFPHSNSRAEIGVKTAKRIITDNTDCNGNLDLDKFQRAILSYRNTPSPDSGISPAQCLFGRAIKEFIPIHRDRYKPHHTWSDTLDQREAAMRNRHMRMLERWSEHTKHLPALQVGDLVRIQNQLGNAPRKWDKTVVIVEVRQYNQYVVKINGSNRITLRNRRFLRRYEPAIQHNPSVKLLERLAEIPRQLPKLPRSTSNDTYRNVLRSDAHLRRDDVSRGAPLRRDGVSRDAPMRRDDVSLDPTQPSPEGSAKGGGGQIETRLPKPPKVPLALRRLADFNKKGLKE